MTPNDSTKVTMTQVYNDVKDALSGMADALKVGAEHVYQILVKQQIVNSITLILCYVLFAFVAYFSFKLVFKAVAKGKEEDSYEPWNMLFIIPTIITISSIVFFSTTIQSCVTGFLNPEYGAIMEIKSFIK
jgi:TRAP-type C4-dicarboxylate transport system permease small subunit